MKITYVPQRADRDLEYAYDGETITATMGEAIDIFDFSGMPDGEASDITSVLDPCPVLAARRTEGVLHVTLLRAIGPRPSDPAELEVWRALWTDDLEVVIDG